MSSECVCSTHRLVDFVRELTRDSIQVTYHIRAVTRDEHCRFEELREVQRLEKLEKQRMRAAKRAVKDDMKGTGEGGGMLSRAGTKTRKGSMTAQQKSGSGKWKFWRKEGGAPVGGDYPREDEGDGDGSESGYGENDEEGPAPTA